MLGGARQAAAGIGELPLVVIIDRDRLPKDRDRLDAGRPGEIGILQELIITGQRCQVVAVSIAVALGEHALGIRGIHDAVGGAAACFIRNIVIHGVERLAGIDPAGIIPDQTIIHGSNIHPRRLAVISAPQENQFLFEHRGGLAFKREPRGADLRRRPARIHQNRGVGRVRIGFVAQDNVEIVQITRREEERIVGGTVVITGIHTDRLRPIEQGLVNFNEAKIVDTREAEGDVAFPTLARLGQQAHIGADRTIPEITHPLIEGVNAREDPLDPTLDQLGIRPPGPRRTRHTPDAGLRPIPHREIIIRHHEQRAAERAGRRATDRDNIRQDAVRQEPG